MKINGNGIWGVYTKEKKCYKQICENCGEAIRDGDAKNEGLSGKMSEFVLMDPMTA
jgi:hypothetical protein